MITESFAALKRMPARRAESERSAGGLNKSHITGLKNNQIKANDTFSERRRGVCQLDGILISLAHLAERVRRSFPRSALMAVLTVT